jgi:muramoyltetrapeptide carboxypeptidase
MKRRTLLLSAATTASLAGCATVSPRLDQASKIIKPPRLRAGDTVGLIAPSGNIDRARLERAEQNAAALGLKVKLGEHVLAKRGNTGGSIDQRVSDIHAMFRDSNVNAVWSVRGGSGAAQLLPHLNYDLIQREAKIFLGFSDATALHLALLARANLMSFHGPVAASVLSDFNAEHLKKILFAGDAGTTLQSAAELDARAASEPHFQPRVLRGGAVEGTLIGGNLITLVSLIGTPYLPKLDRSVLYLEEVREEPYRIDRMLTQLQQSLQGSRLQGVVLGVFSRCEPRADDASLGPPLTLNEALDDFAKNLRVPMGYGFPFGHIAPQITLPCGVQVRADVQSRTITLLESCVV